MNTYHAIHNPQALLATINVLNAQLYAAADLQRQTWLADKVHDLHLLLAAYSNTNDQIKQVVQYVQSTVHPSVPHIASDNIIDPAGSYGCAWDRNDDHGNWNEQGRALLQTRPLPVQQNNSGRGTETENNKNSRAVSTTEGSGNWTQRSHAAVSITNHSVLRNQQHPKPNRVEPDRKKTHSAQFQKAQAREKQRKINWTKGGVLSESWSVRQGGNLTPISFETAEQHYPCDNKGSNEIHTSGPKTSQSGVTEKFQMTNECSEQSEIVTAEVDGTEALVTSAVQYIP